MIAAFAPNAMKRKRIPFYCHRASDAATLVTNRMHEYLEKQWLCAKYVYQQARGTTALGVQKDCEPREADWAEATVSAYVCNDVKLY